jgi:hypothetical protein
MTPHHSVQRVILRLFAFATLAALPGVVAPRLTAEKLSWLMGFGQPPMTPLMLYMMAGGSAVYLAQGLLMGVMSCDVVRYQPLIRVVAWALLLCAPLFWWIDTQAGLPRWWMWMDSASALITGLILIWACHPRGKQGPG